VNEGERLILGDLFHDPTREKISNPRQCSLCAGGIESAAYFALIHHENGSMRSQRETSLALSTSIILDSGFRIPYTCPMLVP